MQTWSQNLHNKHILLRADFNVPMSYPTIRDTTRIDATLPAIQSILASKVKTLTLISHLGRPTPLNTEPQFNLKPIADYLSSCLGNTVIFDPHWPFKHQEYPDGSIILANNVRLLQGETNNDPKLAKAMAKHQDIFIMDAFASAHRQHTSTTGVIDYVPHACLGPLFKKELEALEALKNPKQPVIAIIGGAKISSKIKLLNTLLNRADGLIIGGAMAHTFLKAQGYEIGRSLVENDQIACASELLKKATELNKPLLLPLDAIISTDPKKAGQTYLLHSNQIKDQCIFDIGPQTIRHYTRLIDTAQTIIWNGPMGLFETKAFEQGTAAIAKQIATSQAYTVAGGGDTLACLKQFNLTQIIDTLSTGGGAFLYYLEKHSLPVIEKMKQKAHHVTSH